MYYMYRNVRTLTRLQNLRYSFDLFQQRNSYTLHIVEKEIYTEFLWGNPLGSGHFEDRGDGGIILMWIFGILIVRMYVQWRSYYR